MRSSSLGGCCTRVAAWRFWWLGAGGGRVAAVVAAVSVVMLLDGCWIGFSGGGCCHQLRGAGRAVNGVVIGCAAAAACRCVSRGGLLRRLVDDGRYVGSSSAAGAGCAKRSAVGGLSASSSLAHMRSVEVCMTMAW